MRPCLTSRWRTARGEIHRFLRKRIGTMLALVKRALANACRCAEYYGGDRQTFVNIVKAAATYHDLGKLDAQNQEVLRKVTRAPLPICHEDAGVEQLLQLGRMESAVLAAAHHAGLFSRVDEQQKGDRAFRDLRVCNHVDKSLGSYCDIHAKWITDSLLPLLAKQALSKCGFARRLALSCLVDADYGDTARHYGGESDMPPLGARWSERAVALDKYVSGLPGGATDREREGNELRRTVYGICRDATRPSDRSCDAPVGTGKTTAVMAHLLRVARQEICDISLSCCRTRTSLRNRSRSTAKHWFWMASTLKRGRRASPPRGIRTARASSICGSLESTDHRHNGRSVL